MMKIVYPLTLAFFLHSSFICCGQSTKIDSLLRAISTARNDTAYVTSLLELSTEHQYQTNPDSSLALAVRALQLSQTLDYRSGILRSQDRISFLSWQLGDFPTAIKLGYAMLADARAGSDSAWTDKAYVVLENSYRDQGDYEEALRLYSKHLEQLPSIVGEYDRRGVGNGFIASNYYGLEKYDSALKYINLGLEYPPDFSYGWRLLIAGRIAEKLDDTERALAYYRRSIKTLESISSSDLFALKDQDGAYTSISSLFHAIGRPDSAKYYAIKAVNLAEQNRFNPELLQGYLILSNLLEGENSLEALKYHKIAMNLSSSMYNQEKQRQVASFKFNELLRQNEIEVEQANARDQIRINALLGSTFTFVVIALLLYRDRSRKQKSKRIIEQAYDQLKSTQAQLIQSEKMASLGELTAGIAHEIQNPLNFVNNFAEVNTELLHEMQEEISKGNLSEVSDIAKSIMVNEEKIGHHGKRADAIVKGMLQHSRSSTGIKEPTDINTLAEEYLRLAYHGLKAKDRSFTAGFQTNFDLSIEKINVVPQDIGRVMLNLINNAFYAVTEKEKQLSEGYTPTVWVSTKVANNNLEIMIKDNGNGISQDARDKVFQPFFTTKPAGQGTGLGLSLSYDIIKAHGGELSFETKEDEGSEFVIKIPIV